MDFTISNRDIGYQNEKLRKGTKSLPFMKEKYFFVPKESAFSTRSRAGQLFKTDITAKKILIENTKNTGAVLAA